MTGDQPSAGPGKPLLDGKVRLEPHVMKRLLVSRGWTLKDFCHEMQMQMRTAQNVFRGDRIQMSTAKAVAKKFAVGILDIVDPAEYTPATFERELIQEIGAGEWIPGQVLTPVLTAANGLQYRVYSMTHAFEPLRRGRGKRYEFKEKDIDEREPLKHRLIRHLSVCHRIAPHPQFPICYTSFPDSDRDAWWVVDQWIDGDALADRLKRGLLKPEFVRQVGRQLAEGIAVAHRADVILRELTPATILLAEDDDHVVITDFELAKLTEDYPTVAPEEWPANDYRAPEIGAGEAKPSADVYSWGRIMTHATLGKLPDRGREATALKLAVEDAKWMELLSRCVELSRKKRPLDMKAVLRDIGDQ